MSLLMNGNAAHNGFCRKVFKSAQPALPQTKIAKCLRRSAGIYSCSATLRLLSVHFSSTTRFLFPSCAAGPRSASHELSAPAAVKFSERSWVKRSEEHTSELQSRPHLVC